MPPAFAHLRCGGGDKEGSMLRGMRLMCGHMREIEVDLQDSQTQNYLARGNLVDQSLRRPVLGLDTPSAGLRVTTQAALPRRRPL